MQKFMVYLLYKVESHVWKSLMALAVLVFLVIVFRSTTWADAAYYKVVDNDADRGATTVTQDQFGDKFTKVVYLDQGWSTVDSLWFYNETQGSDLLPYDFFTSLEQDKSEELFRSPENINRYRYLPQRKTKSNPDGLPLGMVADMYRGKKYMGFTCAACHTAQVNHNGVGIRIDGGPGAADMDSFMNGLQSALQTTIKDQAKHQRFVAAVLKVGNYSTASEIEKDLKTYALRIQAYNFFNESEIKDEHGKDVPVPYGYARLDAFGRIYNRVLEHVISPDALRIVLTGSLPAEETGPLLEKLKPVLTGAERDHLIERLALLLTAEEQHVLKDQIFNSPNAPVSYPFIWDIPQHDFVQWNGIGANAGAGPLGRNTGEVIGVFGTLDWEEKDGWTISSVIGGQGFGKTHISFQSSVKGHNLGEIEDRLWTLESPLWTDAVQKAGLPPIDPVKKARGAKLFDQKCARCHAEIDRSSSSRRIVAHMDKVVDAGTDPTMARNSVGYTGFSGILRNQYANTPVGSVLLDTEAPVAAILTKATENVVATPDPDKWFFTRGMDWAVDLLSGILHNQIKASVKSGNYSPDSTVAPFDSLQSYKGRSLNGIWATAPYLHNGSVPTLYDLLLPASPKDGDPKDMKYRPKKFMVGSRELDVDKVGFKHGETEYQGFLYDTSLPANSNAGHDYGTRSFSDQDRCDLVEYLKSL